ncbi:hypothetical protein [Streptomyces sp. NPDC055681]
MEKHETLEQLTAEITLIGTPEESDAAGELLESLGMVIGLVEGYVPFDRAADAVEVCRTYRDQFAAAARLGLQVDDHYVAHDRRPRR